MFGNHHAREWPSAEAPMEFAYSLINGFNAGDARTVDLLIRGPRHHRPGLQPRRLRRLPDLR